MFVDPWSLKDLSLNNLNSLFKVSSQITGVHQEQLFHIANKHGPRKTEAYLPQ